MKEYTCGNCGKRFIAYKYNKRKFCSRECWRQCNRGEKNTNWRGGGVIKNCLVCNKEFTANSHDIKNGYAKFCSRRCMGVHFSIVRTGKTCEKVKRICKQCGKTFLTYPAWIKRGGGKYCSRQCAGKACSIQHLIEKRERRNCVCKYCGGAFYSKPSKIKKGEGIFCSRKCLSLWQHENQRGENHHCWQGGKSLEPYDIEFNERLKVQIRQRDNHACRECNYTEKQLGYKLRIHHIDYDKKNSHPHNLIALCRSCHSKTNYNRDDWTKYFSTYMEEVR